MRGAAAAVVVATLGIVGTEGCLQKAGAIYTATKPVQRSPKPADQIEVLFEGQQPERPFDDVALVNGSRGSETIEQTILAMKLTAGEHGVDGIRELVCAPPGTVGAGGCQGKAYVYKP